MVGDIAIIHGKKPRREDVDEIVGFRHPRGVLWIESLQDVTRTPKTHVSGVKQEKSSTTRTGIPIFLIPVK